jgi:plasmid maintenance system antidote protein VapI
VVRRLAILLLLLLIAPETRAQTADLILTGGRVVTQDAADRIAQAIALRVDTIMAVGTDAEIAALAGPSTRRITLDGRTVIPAPANSRADSRNSGAPRLRENA